MKRVTQRRAEIVRDLVAKATGIDPEHFSIFDGSHERLSDNCKVLVCEGHYPTTRLWDYWTDASFADDDLIERLRSMGVFLEPATVCSAGIIPIDDER